MERLDIAWLACYKKRKQKKKKQQQQQQQKKKVWVGRRGRGGGGGMRLVSEGKATNPGCIFIVGEFGLSSVHCEKFFTLNVDLQD